MQITSHRHAILLSVLTKCILIKDLHQAIQIFPETLLNSVEELEVKFTPNHEKYPQEISFMISFYQHLHFYFNMDSLY